MTVQLLRHAETHDLPGVFPRAFRLRLGKARDDVEPNAPQ